MTDLDPWMGFYGLCDLATWLVIGYAWIARSVWLLVVGIAAMRIALSYYWEAKAAARITPTPDANR